MDLLRQLDGISRLINQQRDKTGAIKQQEETLRKELAAAQAHHAARKASMEEKQKEHFEYYSELQHQETAITEGQAANMALKATISNIHQERTQLWDVLHAMQDAFVQQCCSLNADAQALTVQLHNSITGGHSLLNQLDSSAADAGKLS